MIFPLPIILSREVLHNPSFPGGFPAFPSPGILLGHLIFPWGGVCVTRVGDFIYSPHLGVQLSDLQISFNEKITPRAVYSCCSSGNLSGNRIAKEREVPG